MLLIIKTPFSTRSTENLGEARRRKRAETPLLVWDGRRLHSVGLAWLQVSVMLLLRSMSICDVIRLPAVRVLAKALRGHNSLSATDSHAILINLLSCSY
jgi:hypothetical protein